MANTAPETNGTETTGRNRYATKKVDGGSVTFTFTSGQEVTVSPDDFNDEIQARLMAYGIAQKLGDSYAGAKSVEEAFAFFDEVLGRLQNGDFGVERGPGQSSQQLATAAAHILTAPEAKYAGRPVEDVASAILAKLSAKGEAEAKAAAKLRSQLRASPAIMAKMAELYGTTQKAEPKIDLGI